MKMRIVYYLLASTVLVLATLTATMIVGAVSPLNMWSKTPPPPPTAGPPPTLVPDTTRKGNPVTTRAEAIQRILFLDSISTVRPQPLSQEMIAANPAMIIVEPYATLQEAADAYWGDHYGDPKIASEPVWVVIIKGKVSVKIIGGLAPGKESVESDGVNYVISQETGQLLEVGCGIPQKQTNKP